MAERVSSGNRWSDGEDLVAADLNDSFDFLNNADDLQAEEIAELKLITTRLEFLNSSDASEDAQLSQADLMTDSDGYENTVSTTDAVHITESNQINSFHYTQFDANFSVTQTNVDTGTSHVGASYDPVADEVCIITSVTGNNSTMTYNYEVYDTSGNQLRTGSIDYADPANSSTNGQTFYACEYVSENVVALLARVEYDDNADEASFVLLDVSGDTLKQGKLEPDPPSEWFGATCGASGNYGGCAYNLSERHTTEINETSGGFNDSETIFSNNISAQIAGLYNGGSYVGSVGGSNDYMIGVSLSMGSASVLEHFNGNNNNADSNSGLYQDRLQAVNNTADDRVGVNLTNGNTFEGGSNPGIENGAGKLAIYDSGQSVTKSTSGHTYFPVGGSNYTANAGSNIGDSGTLPQSASNCYSFEGDGTLYQVNSSSTTVEIYHVEQSNSSIDKSTDFEWQTTNIGVDSNSEYVKVRFYTNNSTISQFKLIDPSGPTVVGTYNTEEKVYIGDQSLSNLNVRVTDTELPSETGIQAYSVIVW